MTAQLSRLHPPTTVDGSDTGAVADLVLALHGWLEDHPGADGDVRYVVDKAVQTLESSPAVDDAVRRRLVAEVLVLPPGDASPIRGRALAETVAELIAWSESRGDRVSAQRLRRRRRAFSRLGGGWSVADPT